MKTNKGKTSPLLAILAIVFILAAIVGIYALVKNVQFGERERETGATCSLDPVITLNALNAINKGTAVAVTTNARVNGAYIGAITSGTTSFGYGDKVDLLIGAADHLNITLDSLTIGCGENKVTGYIYATDDSTFLIKNMDGTTVTDSACAGAVNQTSSSTPIDMDVKITANSDESSGDLVIVVEASNTTEIDKIVLSGPGVTTTTVPEFYAVAGAGSIAKAFEVSAIKDGGNTLLNLRFEAESGETMGAVDDAVYVTGYSKQWFVDTDGAFVYGIENSDGTAVYEDDFGYDFCMSTA